MNKWKLLQPGFVDWRHDHPVALFTQKYKSKRLVQWDGTMNMPVMGLADRDHPEGSKVLNW